jgi:hypothetical protein
VNFILPPTGTDTGFSPAAKPSTASSGPFSALVGNGQVTKSGAAVTPTKSGATPNVTGTGEGQNKVGLSGSLGALLSNVTGEDDLFALVNPEMLDGTDASLGGLISAQPIIPAQPPLTEEAANALMGMMPEAGLLVPATVDPAAFKAGALLVEGGIESADGLSLVTPTANNAQTSASNGIQTDLGTQTADPLQQLQSTTAVQIKPSTGEQKPSGAAQLLTQATSTAQMANTVSGPSQGEGQGDLQSMTGAVEPSKIPQQVAATVQADVPVAAEPIKDIKAQTFKKTRDVFQTNMQPTASSVTSETAADEAPEQISGKFAMATTTAQNTQTPDIFNKLTFDMTSVKWIGVGEIPTEMTTDLQLQSINETEALAATQNTLSSRSVDGLDAHPKTAPKHFAEALVAQVKSFEVRKGRTMVSLLPRGFGKIDIEILTEKDNTTRVMIRVENSMVLQALRDERQLLAHAIGMSDASNFDFEQSDANDTGGQSQQQSQGSVNQGTMMFEAETKSEHVDIVADGQLDLFT